MPECCYCKKTYTNEYTLRTHQKTTRACIKLQETTGVSHAKFYYCSICNKECTSKNNLDYHFQNCKKTFKKIEKNINKLTSKLIEEKEDELEKTSSDLRNQKEEFEYELRLKNKKIKELEKLLKEKETKIEKLSKIKTTNSNNANTNSNNTNSNNTNNVTNNNITINETMSRERVEEYFKKHYNTETLLGGQKALAHLVVDGFIKNKDNYLCSDRSRQRFLFIDKNGNRVEDTDCQLVIQLTSSGMPHIKDIYEESLFSDEAADEMVEENLHIQYKNISKLRRDHSQFTSELSRIVPSSVNTNTNTDTQKLDEYSISMNEDANKNIKELAERRARRKELAEQGL